LKYGFDLRNCTFTLTLEADSPTQEDAPTEIFLPDYHFPQDKTGVEVTGGKWRIDIEEVDGEGMQVMRWWHGEGEQNITVKGLKRKLGVISDESEDEVGYLESLWRLANNCIVM
jgi:Glycoside hydrolase family 5 C-terminal domain